ncbi:MAG: HupE/UreJ family protein [Alphaproteobacteria bacterium]
MRPAPRTPKAPHTPKAASEALARGVATITVLLLSAAGMVWAATGTALAHSRSESASLWTIVAPDRLEATFAVDRRRATLLYGLNGGGSLQDRLADHLAGTVSVLQGDARCASERPRPLRAAKGMIRMRLAFACPQALEGEPARIRVDSFFALSAQHRHVIRVDLPDEGARETLLSASRRVVDLAAQGRTGPPLLAFVSSGLTHVLAGPDHLAFIAALLLLCSGWRPVVLTLTGFTLGHSVTLALVAFGMVAPVGAAIEALIGFSIAYSALEAAGLPARRHRTVLILGAGGLLAWALAQGIGSGFGISSGVLAGLSLFLAGMAARTQPGRPMAEDRPLIGLAAAFGLAHGAGFAGGLSDLGLEPAAMLGAVVAFNIGVEAGQILTAATLLACTAALRSLFGSLIAPLREGGIALLIGLGLYWFVVRSVTV